MVAPKRVAEHVWPEERDLWRPDLSLSLAAGSPAQRAAALAETSNITVIGRDNLRDVPMKNQYRTVIIDELSGFKARGSVRWKVMTKLTATTPHVWGLTGTPAPNGLVDLWAQVALLDRGERLERTLTAFRDHYCTPGLRLPNGVIVNWTLKPGADKAIHAKIEDICLSMTTDGRVTLPSVTHNEISVVLPPPAIRAYRDMKNDLVADLTMIGGEIHTAANAAILTAKLSQLTAGFMYSDDYDLNGKYSTVHRMKTDAVLEIIEGTGSPILVFYRFKEELRLLQAVLPQAATIDQPNAIKRWNAGALPVLLAHPASAGHGLNLQHGGHTIVWTTLPWNLEEWEQANKRLHRSGQKNPVVIHRVSATGPKGQSTVDHLIHARLTRKASVQDALIAHLESPI